MTYPYYDDLKDFSHHIKEKWETPTQASASFIMTIIHNKIKEWNKETLGELTSEEKKFIQALIKLHNNLGTKNFLNKGGEYHHIEFAEEWSS